MSGNTIKVKPEQLAAAIRKELESDAGLRQGNR